MEPATTSDLATFQLIDFALMIEFLITIGHPVEGSFCQLDLFVNWNILSICHFSRVVILSIGHFVNWLFCQLVILSIGHFFYWSFS